jgi:hypothetical protein
MAVGIKIFCDKRDTPGYAEIPRDICLLRREISRRDEGLRWVFAGRLGHERPVRLFFVAEYVFLKTCG